MERKRTRARAGETLAEVLVAILVVAMSIFILGGMVNASMSINSQVRQADQGAGGLYPALSGAETHVFDHTTDDPITVKVTGGPSTLTLPDTYAHQEPGMGGLTVYGKEG